MLTRSRPSIAHDSQVNVGVITMEFENSIHCENAIEIVLNIFEHDMSSKSARVGLTFKPEETSLPARKFSSFFEKPVRS